MSLRVETLSVDSRRPRETAEFWAAVLGWQITEQDDDEVLLKAPEGTDLLFLRVPEDKVVKNRLHLDLRPDDQAAEVARVEALGATRVDVGQDETVTWVVLADPEGNEFCILRTL